MGGAERQASAGRISAMKRLPPTSSGVGRSIDRYTYKGSMLPVDRRLTILLCACLLASAGCGARGPAPAGVSLASMHQRAAAHSGARASVASGPFRFFSDASLWNVETMPQAATDPSSTAIIGAFDGVVAGEQHAGNGPWVNTTSYSFPVYTVPANQATVPVKLVGPAVNAALSAAWRAVPLPGNAAPAVGTDANLVVWQPSTERLWEFHRLAHGPAGWQAEWGGAMQNVASSSGAYGSHAWRGAQPWWGASASSLSIVGGLISLEDLQRGQINHALAMAVPDVRAGVYSLPAQRTDGRSSDPLALPEGARLRLNPKLDLPSLHLPRFTMLIAEAAQRYGIYVTDWSSIVEFYAQDPTPTGSNPYAGAGGYFEGKRPSELLAAFPWSQLELQQLHLQSSAVSRLRRLAAMRRERLARKKHRHGHRRRRG